MFDFLTSEVSVESTSRSTIPSFPLSSTLSSSANSTNTQTFSTNTHTNNSSLPPPPSLSFGSGRHTNNDSFVFSASSSIDSNTHSTSRSIPVSSQPGGATVGVSAAGGGGSVPLESFDMPRILPSLNFAAPPSFLARPFVSGHIFTNDNFDTQGTCVNQPSLSLGSPAFFRAIMPNNPQPLLLLLSAQHAPPSSSSLFQYHYPPLAPTSTATSFTNDVRGLPQPSPSSSLLLPSPVSTSAIPTHSHSKKSSTNANAQSSHSASELIEGTSEKNMKRTIAGKSVKKTNGSNSEKSSSRVVLNSESLQKNSSQSQVVVESSSSSLTRKRARVVEHVLTETLVTIESKPNNSSSTHPLELSSSGVFDSSSSNSFALVPAGSLSANMIANVHRIVKEDRPAKCRICGKKFSSLKYAMNKGRKHFIQAHSKQASLDVIDDASYPCQFCALSFNCPENRTRHCVEQHIPVRSVPSDIQFGVTQGLWNASDRESFFTLFVDSFTEGYKGLTDDQLMIQDERRSWLVKAFGRIEQEYGDDKDAYVCWAKDGNDKLIGFSVIEHSYMNKRPGKTGLLDPQRCTPDVWYIAQMAIDDKLWGRHVAARMLEHFITNHLPRTVKAMYAVSRKLNNRIERLRTQYGCVFDHDKSFTHPDYNREIYTGIRIDTNFFRLSRRSRNSSS